MGSKQGGYSNNIEGVPFPGDLPQVDGSAVPNREDSPLLANPEGDIDVPYAIDYFDEAEQAPADPTAPYVASKDSEQWSDGIADEENDYGPGSFGELDNDWNEGALPETEPLQLEATEQDANIMSDFELQPDNIQYGDA